LENKTLAKGNTV